MLKGDRQRLAEAEVNQVLRALPREVASAVSLCAIRLLGSHRELVPEADPHWDYLGWFQGATWAEAHDSGQTPPCITLFLETIWEVAEGDVEAFRKEVRLTLLHEIGHYLGWDEGAVESRGLS